MPPKSVTATAAVPDFVGSATLVASTVWIPAVGGGA